MLHLNFWRNQRNGFYAGFHGVLWFSVRVCVCACVRACACTRARASVLVAQSCPNLYDPIDCSQSGSSVYGILQARILEWVAIPFSRGSSWPRDWTWVSCIVGRFFTVWANRKALWFSPGRSCCKWVGRETEGQAADLFVVAGFPRKLTQSLKRRVLIKEQPWNWSKVSTFLFHRSGQVGVGRGSCRAVMWPNSSANQLSRSLELEWSIMVVLS